MDLSSLEYKIFHFTVAYNDARTYKFEFDATSMTFGYRSWQVDSKVRYHHLFECFIRDRKKGQSTERVSVRLEYVHIRRIDDRRLDNTVSSLTFHHRLRQNPTVILILDLRLPL